ncbi:MAG: helix-turn-helix transcriptional regulator [Acidobacteria bacterium]|nr:helix-turn-helix transcriptional regulator [Acidobacteriota bacterium]
MIEKRSSRRFSDLIRQIQESPGFKVEELKVEIAEQIYLAMERNKISNSELARRMGKSRAYITKILRGNVNFTLETLVAISNALQMDIKFEFTARPVASEGVRILTPVNHQGTRKPALCR